MTEKRIAIYVGEALLRFLDNHGSEEKLGRSRSALINGMADRYQEVIRRSMPTLSANEWCLIWDALNGIWMGEPASLSVFSVPMEAADHIKLNGADEKWEIDGPALVKRLADMGWPELLAIVDATERFWATDFPEETGRYDMVTSIVGQGAVTK